ncbi:MAG: response regulator [Candidatus Acidiferrales bacterium]
MSIRIRCHNCGTRADVILAPTEIERLREAGSLTRFCRECRGQTRWEPVEGPPPAHLADVEPEQRVRSSILLIDDDESILAVLEKALSAEHFDVDVASSGREAVQLLARGDYSLVLSDIRMPAFDGQQLFRFLDEHMPEAKDKVIFLTGDTGNPKTMDFLNETKRPYLTKPLDIPTLLKMVREALSTE